MRDTSVDVDPDVVDREPTAAELAAIEATEPAPVLLAEYRVFAAQYERPSTRTARRVRRAVVRLLTAHRDRAASSLVNGPLVPPERWGWAR